MPHSKAPNQVGMEPPKSDRNLECSNIMCMSCRLSVELDPRQRVCVDLSEFFFQSECHPWLVQKELRSYCKEQGIFFQAYSSFGTGEVRLCVLWRVEGGRKTLIHKIFFQRSHNNESYCYHSCCKMIF